MRIRWLEHPEKNGTITRFLVFPDIELSMSVLELKSNLTAEREDYNVLITLHRDGHVVLSGIHGAAIFEMSSGD